MRKVYFSWDIPPSLEVCWIGLYPLFVKRTTSYLAGELWCVDLFGLLAEGDCIQMRISFHFYN